MSSTVSNSWAQETPQIPNWIKNNAGWWANDEITENEFLNAIQYLIKNEIIVISDIASNEGLTPSIDFSYKKMVPNWIKNNAGWWANDEIPDSAFISGLEWLISKEIIQVENKKIPTHGSSDVFFASGMNVKKSQLTFLFSNLFDVYGFNDDYFWEFDEEQGLRQLWISAVIALNPEYMDTYEQIAMWDDPHNVAVVYPIFTASAYQGYDLGFPFASEVRGFYNHFRGECECTTVKIIPETDIYQTRYQASGMGIQVLSLLGYTTLTDIDVDQNPDILKEFDSVIMLHNEYVTRTIFDAVTDHPHVLYLYPNALYAEIEVNYDDNTITLIRGHGYPEPDIDNGFDWEFDNTRPYEFDEQCLDMQFMKIDNGWMTNCYPELRMNQEPIILSAIKNITTYSGE